MVQQLFKRRTIEKYSSQISLTEEQKNAANEWIKLLELTKLEDEKKNYFRFADIILRRILGYPIHDFDFDQKVEFVFDDTSGERIVCIEAKGTKTKDLTTKQSGYKKHEQETPIKQTWDYMGQFNLDYGICTNYREYILIKRNFGYSKRHSFDFLSIKSNEEKLKEFIAIFSKKNLIDSDEVEELINTSEMEEREFTEEFYKLFHETRLMLIEEFKAECKLPQNRAIHYAQLFLNRLIFMFFAEDNSNIPDKLFTERIVKIIGSGLLSEHSAKISEEIKGVFTMLDKGSAINRVFGFNGGLFQEEIPSEVQILDLRDSQFFAKIELHSKLKKQKIELNKSYQKVMKKYEKQLNPIILNLVRMDNFNFKTELNVNILGQIFEHSITDIEALKDEKTSRQKREGIFYTPDYITDYICNNTIIPFLSKKDITNVNDLVKEYEENIDELKEKIKKIKILDLACGSGAFLIKAVEILLDIDREIQKIKVSQIIDKQFQLEEYHKENEIFNIIENNIYGVDINEESVNITKLSLFLQLVSTNRKLIDLSQKIKVGNSLVDDPSTDEEKYFVWEKEFPEVVGKTGFDVIIGNPPYGAELSKKEQQFLNEKFAIGSTDTAQLMIILADGLLSKGGYNGFIVPKALTYASNWKKTRELLLKNLFVLMDMGKVWKEVKLEQTIFLTRDGSKTDSYLTGSRKNHLLEAKTTIPKTYSRDFDFLLNGLTNEELILGEKIFSNSDKLSQYTTNVRGAMIQKLVTASGETRVNGGQQIQRYSIIGEKGFVNKNKINDQKAFVISNSVLAQNIVAHIENPVDHIKITATVPSKTDFVILDTVNQISSDKVSPYFIAGLMNSKLINWYSYRFIFAKAIRTMHFDKPSTDKIPIIVKDEKKVVKLVKSLIENNSKLSEISFKFVENAKRTFEIDKTTRLLKNFENYEFNEFLKQVKKIASKTLSYEEEDSWMDYFNGKKKESRKCSTENENLEEDLNSIFYQIFSLTPEETEMINESTPE